MPVCFRLAWAGVVLAAGACAANNLEPAATATAVVRADPRSGRLVRSVVVNSKIVPEKVIRPVEVKAGAQNPGRTTTARTQGTDLMQLVDQTAEKYEVDPLLVHSVIEVESNYNPLAVSPKGAEGLMQLIPATARRFGVKNSFNVRENVEGGVKYLKYLSGLFPGDLRLVLAAYNAGEGAVVKYNNSVPRYPETENYVYRVGKKYGEKKSAARRSGRVQTAGQTAENEYRPVEHFVDAEGRLHLRTR